MNRVINFRGYNIKNKKWLYGYYFVNRGKHFIVEDGIAEPQKTWEDFEVDPKSLGELVANYAGKPIYEGDEVMVESSGGEFKNWYGIVKYDNMNCSFVVKFKVQCGITQVPITGDRQRSENMNVPYYFFYRYKVVGNEYESTLGK